MGKMMTITEAYFTQAKNTHEIFAAIINAQAPEKFTQKFLYDLGFTGVNDRPFVQVLKALGFIDESGVPKQRYYDYLDEENSKTVLAQGIREAYGDLFAVNQKANELPAVQVKGKLKSLLQGKKSEAVLQKMSTTFSTLCTLADFNSIPKTLEKKSIPKAEHTEKVDSTQKPTKPMSDEISLKYSINIELPTTRDQLVYDAIFKSIKENLL
jgi:Family of unknown function (DUF5343)